MRQPTSQPEPGTLDRDELDARLPDMDPVTAVYFAAQPVLRTLTTVPALDGFVPPPYTGYCVLGEVCSNYFYQWIVLFERGRPMK